MSYESMATLSKDEAFNARVEECCLEQALIFKNDTRYSFYALANGIIAGATAHSDQIFQLVIATPNFKDITDAASVPDIEILSAVQGVWGVYGGIVFIDPNPPQTPLESPGDPVGENPPAAEPMPAEEPPPTEPA